MKDLNFLAAAILFEVIGTSALKASESFTRLGPTVLTLSAYATAFYFLSITLKTVPVGLAYAIWSGVGIVLVTLIALVIYHQVPRLPDLIGMGLIVAGVVVINLFSNIGGTSS
ncbi:DMT family transporter [Isoalcanivorax beigongshangi]|uniref:Multidrug efflux SMR transporter n=1 Tax=Isoalcanivorax beigongshangi TaxID=3238810 RepID=A0ABV4AJY5_9GAMM